MIRREPLLAAAFVVALLGCGGTEEEKRPIPFRETASSTTAAPAPTPPAEPTRDAPLAYRPNVWKVGDLVTTTGTFKQFEDIVATGADGAAKPLNSNDQDIATRWIEKVAAVDADGRRTRYLVHFAEWLRTNGDTRDQSLAGVSIAVTGHGGTRAWSYVGARAEQTRTEAAERWLDERYGPNPIDDEEARRLMLPPRPTAVGATWTPDVAGLIIGFRKEGMVIDREKSIASATFESLRDGLAALRFTATLPVSRVPGLSGPRTTWMRPLTFVINGEMTVPLTGRLRIEPSIEQHVVVSGEAKTAEATVRLDVRQDETLRSSEGGDFPASDG